MKPPPDLIAYFDLARRDRVKLEIRKEQAGLESLQAINLWKETFRYDYVVKLAEANARAWVIDNPESFADISQAEAEAVRELVDVVSRGRSVENYRKHHRFWKFLHDVRVEGDPTGLEDTETLNGTRALNGKEQQLYLANLDSISRSEELSLQTTTEVLRDGVDGQLERNNAIYICLIPFEGPLNGKRKINGASASRTIVAPCPVVPIQPGDFLGVMSGQLRYTLEAGRLDEAIQGPDPNLWLNFFKITGKLNYMRSGIGTKANVALTWKGYKDQHGMNWRVEVVATIEIWPFHELVRPILESKTSPFRQAT
ncbi:hypothetical protein IFR05_005877 [Cadophora sp. M221]|nr:hypothetical protein IFR05_005877 [Cadophora sp. M221]